MDTEVKGKFRYEQDSKRYHRFQIETNEGLTGTVYIPKHSQPLPEKLVLERADIAPDHG